MKCPLKFIYSEKATKFCEIFTLLLTLCTVVKSKLQISQNFVAFSEYMNFTTCNNNFFDLPPSQKYLRKNHRIYTQVHFLSSFFTLERKSVWIEQFDENNFMKCLKGENNQHFQFLSSMMLWITVHAQCTSISNFWLTCYVN